MAPLHVADKIKQYLFIRHQSPKYIVNFFFSRHRQFQSNARVWNNVNCIFVSENWFPGLEAFRIQFNSHRNTDVRFISKLYCVCRAVEQYLTIAMMIIITRRKPSRPKNVCAKQHVIETVVYVAYHISPISAIQKRHQQHQQQPQHGPTHRPERNLYAWESEKKFHRAGE